MLVVGGRRLLSLRMIHENGESALLFHDYGDALEIWRKRKADEAWRRMESRRCRGGVLMIVANEFVMLLDPSSCLVSSYHPVSLFAGFSCLLFCSRGHAMDVKNESRWTWLNMGVS